MVNLTSLAPDKFDAILHEQLPPPLTLFDLAVDTPVLWGGAAAAVWAAGHYTRVFSIAPVVTWM